MFSLVCSCVVSISFCLAWFRFLAVVFVLCFSVCSLFLSLFYTVAAVAVRRVVLSVKVVAVVADH